MSDNHKLRYTFRRRCATCNLPSQEVDRFDDSGKVYCNDNCFARRPLTRAWDFELTLLVMFFVAWIGIVGWLIGIVR